MTRSLDIAIQGTVSYGGVGRFTAEISRALAERGHSVTIYPTCMSVSNPADHDWFSELPTGVDVDANEGLLRNSIRDLQAFGDHDVIHANYGSFGCRALPANARGTPVVLTIHGSLQINFRNRTLARRIKYMLERGSLQLLSGTYRIVTVSAYSAALVREKLGVQPEFVYHGYTDEEQTSEGTGLETNSAVTILTIGRFYESKDISSLLVAYHMLRDRTDRQVRLFLVGGGEEEAEIRAYIRANSLDDVHVFNDISDEALAEILNESDIFVLPSYGETFGIVLLEAMSHDLPVVCVDEGAAPEIVDDAGIVAEARNPQSIADAVGSLVADTELYERYQRCGRERLEDFDWATAAKKYEEIYREELE